MGWLPILGQAQDKIMGQGQAVFAMWDAEIMVNTTFCVIQDAEVTAKSTVFVIGDAKLIVKKTVRAMQDADIIVKTMIQDAATIVRIVALMF